MAPDRLSAILLERIGSLGRVDADISLAMTSAELSPEARALIGRLADLVGPAGFDAVRDLVLIVWDEATIMADDGKPPY